MINLDILNDHEPDSDHRPLIVTINFSMHCDPIEDNPHNQKHLIFDRNKEDLFINELKNQLVPLSYKNNIEDLYHNFITTISSSINKFSIEVLSKKSTQKINPWYDKECKIARRAIKEAIEESQQIDKIIEYKALVKRKKTQYIIKKQENILHLSKVAPRKFWRQFLSSKTKDNNKISLEHWNSYLKNIYESSYVINNI